MNLNINVNVDINISINFLSSHPNAGLMEGQIP